MNQVEDIRIIIKMICIKMEQMIHRIDLLEEEIKSMKKEIVSLNAIGNL